MVQTELLSTPQVALLGSIKPINAEQTGKAKSLLVLEFLVLDSQKSLR